MYNMVDDFEKAIGNHSDFLVISFIGAICPIIGSIITLGTPEVWKCQAQIAFTSFGFDLFYVPFFVRILRIFILKRLAMLEKTSP